MTGQSNNARWLQQCKVKMLALQQNYLLVTVENGYLPFYWRFGCQRDKYPSKTYQRVAGHSQFLLVWARMYQISDKSLHSPSVSTIFGSPSEPPDVSFTFFHTQHSVVRKELSGRVVYKIRKQKRVMGS